MFTALANPQQAYKQAGVDVGITTADPHQLILMLFDGALLAVSAASIALDRNDIEARAQAITRANDIISNGLKVSLDRNANAELADRLAALYDYICSRLLYASLHKHRPALDEATRLLVELKAAWEEIGTHEA